MFFGVLFTTSCSNEKMAVNSVENMKTTDMRNFDSALKKLMKPENRSTPEEKARLGAQLNDKSLDILYSASKQLLNIEEDRLGVAVSRADKEQVISRATKLYFEKIGKINSTIKSEN